MAVASLGKIADKLKLVNLTDKMDLEEHKVIIPDVNPDRFCRTCIHGEEV